MILSRLARCGPAAVIGFLCSQPNEAMTNPIFKVIGIDPDGEEFFLGSYATEWQADNAADGFANQFGRVAEIIVRRKRK